MTFVDVVRTASILDVRRTRKLPLPGCVLVSEGDRVNPQDVIAEALLPERLVILDIARGLNIPMKDVEACLVRGIGDELESGDIIAQFEGAFPRLVRAPLDGCLVDVTNGRAVMAVVESQVQVRAGMIGDVVEIVPEYGAVLQTRGCLLQGVWGNEKISMGTLHWIEPSQEGSIQVSSLDGVESGQLLAADICLQTDVLDCAVEKEVAGLIFNVMAMEMIPAAMVLPIPVIVLGIFGGLLPGQKGADLLRVNEGKTACMNASNVDRYQAQRPEVIVPLDEQMTGESLEFQVEVTVGRRVRILSGEHAGRTGEVMECPELPHRFESGLVCLSAVVHFEDEESATVPLENLIVLN